MRLVSTVLGFLLKKLALLVALVLSLFLGYMFIQTLIPTLREAVADRDRLQQVAEARADLKEDLELLRSTAAESQSQAVAVLEARIDAEVEEGRRNVTEKRADIERLREEELCGLAEKILAVPAPGNVCDTAEEALEQANEALDTLEQNLGQAEAGAAVLSDPDLTPQQKLDRLDAGGEQALVQREIDSKEAELAQKEAEEQTLEEAQASGVGWVVNQWAKSC
jgi:hypothetical protein